MPVNSLYEYLKPMTRLGRPNNQYNSINNAKHFMNRSHEIKQLFILFPNLEGRSSSKNKRCRSRRSNISLCCTFRRPRSFFSNAILSGLLEAWSQDIPALFFRLHGRPNTQFFKTIPSNVSKGEDWEKGSSPSVSLVVASVKFD